MDTLSRKHRLRQQLLQQVYRNKEINGHGNDNNNNNKELQEQQVWQEWRQHKLQCGHPHQFSLKARQNYQDNNGMEEDGEVEEDGDDDDEEGEEEEEEFRVFRVDALQRISGEHFVLPSAFPDHYAGCQSGERKSLRGCQALEMNESERERASDHDRFNFNRAVDEELLGSRPKLRSSHDSQYRCAPVPASGKRITSSLNTSDCSTSSSQSTVDSSGFVSYCPSMRTANAKLSGGDPKQTARLMDHPDLELVEALQDERPPSTISTVADTTLTRAGDYCCSTPCRDDFSSFIPAHEPEATTTTDHYSGRCKAQSGPNLVGLHDEAPPTAYQDVLDFEDDDDDDSELSCELSPKTDNCSRADDSELSKMLDIHIARMNSLLRLMAGDRKVSLGEAFDDEPFQVSAENTTAIQYELVPRQPTVKVTQEVQSVELGHLDEGCEPQWTTKVVSSPSDLGSISATDQVSAELDWSASDVSHTKPQLASLAERKKIADQLMARLVSLNLGGWNERVEAKVKEHVHDFLNIYERYQAWLEASTGFATDWRQNWLFAHKRPQEAGSEPSKDRAKRARLSCSQQDLLAYSTLLLSKAQPRPVRLTYLLEDDRQVASEIEALYSDCKEPIEELRSADRSGVDICSLLLNGSFADGDELELRKAELATRQKRPLKVAYLTSYTPAQVTPGRFHFCAFGYLFESALIARGSQRRDQQVKRIVLAKLRQQVETATCRRPADHHLIAAQDRVSFGVSLAGSVELVNEIPVIQFCAKVCGSLPINVRWFRQATEIGEAKPEAERQSPDWPVGMRAAYELSYETEWASRYTFRRRQDEIMFEIRNPHAELDYEQSYKCVLENSYSSCESVFTLCHRKLPAEPRSKVAPKVEKSKETADRALMHLRTWSQRTLHKPVPSTRERPEVVQKSGVVRLQTVGRLSCSAPSDKFGKDFPYHPENLLKRLQENKFSSSTLLKRHRLQLDQSDNTVSHLELNLDRATCTIEATIEELQHSDKHQVSQSN